MGLIWHSLNSWTSEKRNLRGKTTAAFKYIKGNFNKRNKQFSLSAEHSTETFCSSNYLLISFEALSGNGHVTKITLKSVLHCYNFPGALKIHLKNTIWEKYGRTGEKGESLLMIVDCFPLKQLVSEIVFKEPSPHLCAEWTYGKTLHKPDLKWNNSRFGVNCVMKM